MANRYIALNEYHARGCNFARDVLREESLGLVNLPDPIINLYAIQTLS